jgi:hypothetical protein
MTVHSQDSGLRCAHCEAELLSSFATSCPSCGAPISSLASSMNPFEAPIASSTPSMGQPVVEGRYWLGFTLGAVFGLWGVIGALIFAKRETKRGAAYGFGARLLVTLVALAVMFALGEL